MSEALKPCPFCGGTVSIARKGDKKDCEWFITRGYGDKKCTCRVFMESEQFQDETGGAIEKAKLIRRWNNRVGLNY